MEVKQLKALLNEKFKSMVSGVDHLFEVNLNKDELWELYLDSFPVGTNEFYKERREYDCNACRQFIKRIGNVVSIKNGEVQTIWDVTTGDDKFQQVVNTLSSFVKEKAISGVFSTKEKHMGLDKNRAQEEDGTIITWEHLYLELPKKFINTTSSSDAEIRGDYKSSKDVFKRSLDEITEESLLTVLELIRQKSLYKGEEWESVLNSFLNHKKAYMKLSTEQEKDLYTWEESVKNGGALTRIRNHSIGTLLVDISNNEDLDSAVTKYEKIVAPSNYKRPKAIFTKKMLEEAQKTVSDLGYQNSLQRRFATLDDITVNNILFSNKDAANRIVDANDVFAQLSASIPENPKKFSKVEEISIEDFVKNVLPTTTSLEAFVENKHSKNFVSLIAPENKNAETMFKWNNPFGWAYTGNITDSTMKENVKSAGGKVDGVLRFSIQWNDVEKDKNDLDAHCIEPRGSHIYYGNSNNYSTTGALDVDIRFPKENQDAVENITWSDINRMEEGVYKFYVHNFSHNGGRSGFRAEIEYDGQIFSFDYPKELREGEEVTVAEVKYDSKNGFTIVEKLPSNVSSKEVWGVQTNQFIPVAVSMYSPNYWDDQEGIGHKHYFFMLKDCVNPELPNGFYNEFLQEDLMKHKRVFEALGSKLAVKEVEDQLSGLGFSSTKRNEVLVKVTGQTERVLKIKF
ncbi:hypothetical protein ABNX05_11170 [Lysinibacillus sp. M3]|uniref:Uncharacterized protein n=2 Tax=Lysinibacillus zambalensis TaxID=3160866 RepID=A0ABV1MTF1_9BACI